MAVAVLAFAFAASLAAALALLRLRVALRRTRHAEDLRAAAAQTERFCPVTGLANRQRALEWFAASDGAPAAIAIAIDGHRFAATQQAALARPFAERLAFLAGEQDLAARVGAAEYLLALADQRDPAALLSRAQAVHVALAPLLVDGQRLRLGAALAAPHDTTEKLVANAEQAIASAGFDGQVSIGVYGAELEGEQRNRAVSGRALAGAIAEGRIEPFFQPLVELGSGKVLGFEVLARWRDEEGHLRLPGEFVPLAEEAGLVGEMYFALLRRAATEVCRWPAEWTFTLNLSPFQFADEWLVERTAQTLLKAGVALGRLELEVSERALEHDLDGARRMITALRRRGIRIALDQFGSGRMALRDLAQLEFDRLKVEGSVLGDEAARGATFGVIAAAAHYLGVPVVVQGIETRDRANLAQLRGASIGQGFLFGRPDPQTEYFRLDGSLARRAGKSA